MAMINSQQEADQAMRREITKVASDSSQREYYEALKEQYMAMQNSYAGLVGSQLTGPINTAMGQYLGSGYATSTGSTWATLPQTPPPQSVPYVSTEDSWSDKDNQEAAGMGWMLTAGHYSPKVIALSFGAKKEWSEARVLQDVVESAMCGNSPIAYKILCIISKNRSPHAEWEPTCRALESSYEK